MLRDKKEIIFLSLIFFVTNCVDRLFFDPYIRNLSYPKETNATLAIVEKNWCIRDIINMTIYKFLLITNEIRLLYKANTKTIAYIMARECVVTQYHRSKIEELGVTPTIEA